MKRFFQQFALAAAAASMLTACLGDDEETMVTTYGDMMIQTFTLGTLNRYQTVVSPTTGLDSTVVTHIDGTQYPLTIDHVNDSIYNETPLPKGTDWSHVTCNITTKNNGVVYLKLLDRDSLYYHNSTDSVDLSVVRTFRVYAINGSGHRDYHVRLNRSDIIGTSFGWQQLSGTNTGIGSEPLSASRLVAVDTCMLLMAAQQGATSVYKAVSREGLTEWEALQPAGQATLGTDAWQNAVSANGTLYILSNGQLLSTQNATDWTATTPSASLLRLVAASSTELYAIGTDSTMMCSADGGNTWTTDSLEWAPDAALLPTDATATISWPYAGSSHTDCVLLAGQRPDNSDSSMLIWRKICHNDRTGNKGRWTYMPYDYNNPYRLPRTQQTSIVSFQQTLLALGQDKQVYQSRDEGLSWRPNTTYKLPDGCDATACAMATASDGSIWLTDAYGQIWIGMPNS